MANPGNEATGSADADSTSLPPTSSVPFAGASQEIAATRYRSTLNYMPENPSFDRWRLRRFIAWATLVYAGIALGVHGAFYLGVNGVFPTRFTWKNDDTALVAPLIYGLLAAIAIYMLVRQATPLLPLRITIVASILVMGGLWVRAIFRDRIFYSWIESVVINGPGALGLFSPLLLLLVMTFAEPKR